MKIKDLKLNEKVVELKLKVDEWIEEGKLDNGVDFARAIVTDGTDKIKLTVYHTDKNANAKRLKQFFETKEEFVLANGYCSEHEGRKVISSGKFGWINSWKFHQKYLKAKAINT